jgi:hypothetical protein
MYVQGDAKEQRKLRTILGTADLYTTPLPGQGGTREASKEVPRAPWDPLVPPGSHCPRSSRDHDATNGTGSFRTRCGVAKAPPCAEACLEPATTSYVTAPAGIRAGMRVKI